ncbi:MAG TPA: hypothetical protein VKN99_25655 [Polyangia bacterium]|nr:hypothetical protein [Polyangia bacterium]
MRPRALGAIALACALAACTADLEHGLTENQANRMIAALLPAGVAAEKVPEGAPGGESATYTLRVPAGEAARALDILRAADLPREPGRAAAALERASLLPTPAEERARYQAGLASEIGRTLEAIDGVLAARVHLALPEPAGELGADAPAPPGRPLATASVLLKVRPERAPSVSVEDMQRLVAGAVAGLAPADVRIVIARVPEAASALAGAGELAALGPLKVERSSRAPLQLLLASLLFAVLALSTALLAFARRLARLRARVGELERAQLERPASREPEAAPESQGRAATAPST